LLSLLIIVIIIDHYNRY